MNGNIPEDDWLGRSRVFPTTIPKPRKTEITAYTFRKYPNPSISQSPRRMNRRDPDSRRNPTASLRFPRNPSLKKSPSYTAPRVK